MDPGYGHGSIDGEQRGSSESAPACVEPIRYRRVGGFGSAQLLSFKFDEVFECEEYELDSEVSGHEIP